MTNGHTSAKFHGKLNLIQLLIELDHCPANYHTARVFTVRLLRFFIPPPLPTILLCGYVIHAE